jgi:PAS domain S-box-containing protein
MEEAGSNTTGDKEETAPQTEVRLEILEALVEHSSQPMLLSEPSGRILLVNQAFCDLLGQTKEHVLQVGRAGCIDPTDLRWKESLAKRSKEGYFKGELNLLHRNQEKIPVEFMSREFVSFGKVYTSVNARDLRKEKEAQAIIARQHQVLEKDLIDFQLILDHSADLIGSFALDGTIIYMNRAAETVLGYSPQEMVGRNYREFIYPEDISATEEDTRLIQVGDMTTQFSNRYVHKNGSLVYLSWVSTFSPGQKVGYSMGRDVTRIRQQELQIQESESRLQALLLRGSDMIAILSEEAVFTFASANSEKVIGVPKEDFIGKNVFDMIHPEDHAEVMTCLEQVLKGEVVDTKPFRFMGGQGEWRWLESYVTNCLDVPNIQGIVVNSRDITLRRKQEMLLAESEQRYKALFDYNPDAVYSLNKEGKFTSVNEAVVNMLQVPRETLLQMEFRDLSSPDSLEEDNLNFEKVMRGEPVTTETPLYIPGRGTCYFTFTVMPIVINGEVVGAHGIAKDITASKKQQFLLETTAKRLDSTLKSIKDAFFTLDHAWRFTYLNKGFEEIMEVRAEELLGQDIRAIYDPEQFGNFYVWYEKALAEKVPVHFEGFSSPLGMWLDVSAFPSEEGLTVYFREINDRKKAEEELKKLSLVASKTVNSVYITDDEARVEWVNEGFTRITGYTLEEVRGRKPGDLLAGPETNANRISTIREKLVFDKPFVQEVQNKNKAGEVYWSKLDVTPIIDEQSGGDKKFIVIETVITEQKKAEEERAQLTEELLRRNRHLEQFTYIVSHNLRSPVANIMGLTSLLNGTESPTLQEGITARLKQTAQNLDNIIRDLNELLSLQAGVLEEREKFSLPEVVDQVLQVLPGECYGAIKVNLNGVQEIGSIRSYVSSILSNLLTNAVKYKSPDRAMQLSITAELLQEGELLCLSVADNGLGIDLDKQGKNLFGLYKRFHFHVSGRGLGLYLVKTQAEALGGYVTVESEPDKGSTFKVFIKNSR